MFYEGTVRGNLTAEPELRYSPQGTAWAKLRVARDKGRMNGDRWEKQATIFYSIVVFGRMAEAAAELKTGQAVVAILGAELPKVDAYKTRDGEARAELTVQATLIATPITAPITPAAGAKATRRDTTAETWDDATPAPKSTEDGGAS